jgi:hypothetical protein
MAYRYCYDALYSQGSADATTAAARLDSGVNANFRRDLDEYSRFFKDNTDKKAQKTANNVNDTYLKTSGDAEGVASYDQVTDLLVSWHIQQIVLPSQQEDESVFDPYDETQVDLSGIVTAMDKMQMTDKEDAG